jgi:SMI1/KNR4 family protein SUKH-1
MDLSGMQLALEGAPAEQLDALQLPDDLRAFLAKHDGGRGTVGARARPLVLWGAAQIAREADEQEVTRATPGLVLFGTDGGAEGYGYLPRLQRGKYGRISLMAAGAHEFESLGDTLDELVSAVAQGR